MLIRIPKPWELPERQVTPEANRGSSEPLKMTGTQIARASVVRGFSKAAYRNRREILAAAGFFGLESLLTAEPSIKRNPDFDPGRSITEEWAATGYNNFYEFNSEDKTAVKNLVGNFITEPWTIKVSGLVAKPLTLDVASLLKRMPLEERVYRFRCVEAWAMTVPWTGFPMAALIKELQPKPEAKFIRFVTAHRPEQMPGIARYNWYKWPYYESLRLDEAMNPLALFATGLYGKPLPKQNGAPFRAILPWKYGYKSIKSIEKIEFVAKKPGTFWNDLQPLEYGYYSNVNPKKAHPRWSQASERVIPTNEKVPTLPYNGYEKWVGSLYKGNED